MLAAIDPGQKGAYAIDGNAYPLYKGSDSPIDAVEDMVAQGVTMVLIENAETLRANGAQTNLINWGRLKQCLLDNGIGVEEVRAGVWKRTLGIADSKASPKEKKVKAIQKAKDLYPKASLRRTEKCTTDCDGMAEALLILEYGYRKGLR